MSRAPMRLLDAPPRLVVGVLGGASILSVALILRAYASSEHRLLLADASWTLAAAVMVVGVAYGRARSRPLRRAYTYLLAASIAWLVGELLWDGFTAVGDVPNSPNLADLTWFAFPLLGVVGLREIAGARRRLRDPISALETVPLVAAATVAAVAVSDGALKVSSLDMAGKASVLLYPILFTSTLVLMLQALVETDTATRFDPGVLALTLGMAVEAVAFILWAPLLLRDEYVSGRNAIDPLFTVGLVLAGLGAAFARPRRDTSSPGAPGGLLPALVFFGLLGYLAIAAIRGTSLDVRLAAIVAVFLCGVSILTRAALLAHEQRGLRLQERAFEERLRETQRLESLGVLAGGVAHDFNNLLVGVLGNAALAREHVAADSALAPLLDDIELAARRAADLTRQMLAYAGRTQPQMERLDLVDVVVETRKLLHSVLIDDALQLDLDPATPPIAGDATQIRQVVMNLLTNASEALRDGAGHVRVRTRGVTASDAFLAQFLFGDEAAPGRYALLSVSDDGVGMDEATRERIFEPFYTTKHTGRGLGLSAVLGILRAHGGAIRVDSSLGGGTTFSVLLPASAHTTERVSVPVAASGEVEGRILLADDNELVRNLATRALEDAGFDVVATVDGADALEAFRAEPDAWAAIVLDLTMPRVDGIECLHEIRRLDPDATVVMSSGYSDEELDVLASAYGVGTLQKPYAPQELVDAVAAQVARARA